MDEIKRKRGRPKTGFDRKAYDSQRSKERLSAVRELRELRLASEEVGIWLEGALNCKDWDWSPDQYGLAVDALIRLRSKLLPIPKP